MISALKDGHDTENHLLGGHLFVEIAQEGHGEWLRLGRAAYWIHQRQDVYSAIVHQSPPRTDLQWGHLSHVSDAMDLYSWTKRATALAGEVAGFCFGPNNTSTTIYVGLHQKITDWDDQSPAEFTPLYQGERDEAAGQFFPEIRFAMDPCCKSLMHLFARRCEGRFPFRGNTGMYQAYTTESEYHVLLAFLRGRR